MNISQQIEFRVDALVDPWGSVGVQAVFTYSTFKYV